MQAQTLSRHYIIKKKIRTVNGKTMSLCNNTRVSSACEALIKVD